MLVSLILSLLPPVISMRLRRLLGARIEKGARISFGTLLHVPNRHLAIGRRSTIAPGSFIRCKHLSIGSDTRIGPFSKLTLNSLVIGDNAKINSFAIMAGTSVSIGDHSMVFEYCFFDAGQPISIGKRVGIGGHGLIFTHGSWSNFLEGGPVAFGPVTIEDEVWLPWRVFVLPNVTIGHHSIVGANSLVARSIPPHSMAAGSPAKVIKSDIMRSTPALRAQRMDEVLQRYRNASLVQLRVSVDPPDPMTADCDLMIFLNSPYLPHNAPSGMSIVDYATMTAYIANSREEVAAFLDFVTIYGLRFDRVTR